MRSLYLRIWLTVVAALALFALVSGWMWQRHLEEQRERFERDVRAQVANWAELVQRSLPPADAPVESQAEALRSWSMQLRMPLALDDVAGQRIAASPNFEDLREADRGRAVMASYRLTDGRTLHVRRRIPRALRDPFELSPPARLPPIWPGPVGSVPPFGPGPSPAQADGSAVGPGLSGGAWPPGGRLGERASLTAPGERLGERPLPAPPERPPEGFAERSPERPPETWGPLGADPRGPDRPGFGPPGDPGPRPRGDGPPPESALLFGIGLPSAIGPLVLVGLLFLAVAAGAYPVVRRLTRRLESLKQGVAAFGAGDLTQRVDASGNDEVAEVAETFNRSAERIETLVRSHKSLLANASHELRSPLARLKMAVAMLGDGPPAQQAELKREIHTNIRELDALVEEVLLASRLDAGAGFAMDEPVDLLGIAAEEGARVGAQLAVDDGGDWVIRGNDRLLRRALRNLLENARRYGGEAIDLQVAHDPSGGWRIRVLDRGPGVPEVHRLRIFEPYFRLPGHAEREGGVGLGLSLVRQIAQAHGGGVECRDRPGGGTVFEIRLPVR